MDYGRLFEWDEINHQSNLEKHGIDFQSIAPIFEDENALLVRDDRKDYGEERTIMIGRCFDMILFVVYTVRNEKTRLISARLASQKERDLYERT